MTKPPGIFVSIDGPNGVGKSTLVAAVRDYLVRSGLRVHLTKEVTTTPLGKFIRDSHRIFRGKTLAYLIAADRQHHVENDIMPALQHNDVVITDRYIESSLVYQSLDGVDLQFIWKLNSEFPKPALSIYVTAPAAVITARMLQRENFDRFEEQFSRGEEVRAFDEIASFMKSNGFYLFRFVNEDGSVEGAARTLSEEILKAISRRSN